MVLKTGLPGSSLLAFEVEGNKARLMIRDDGKYFSPDQAAIPDVEADWGERDIGGLGMYFVKELMDRVTYQKAEQNVNLLVLEKDLGPSISQKENTYGYSKQTGQ
jgi:anti-sigma regulatory factor (Ser/Thr protein kinase)